MASTICEARDNAAFDCKRAFKFVKSNEALQPSEYGKANFSKRLANTFFYCVTAMVLFYIILLWQVGATQSAAALLIGFVFFTPLTQISAYKGHSDFSRLVLIVSCNFYIFFASMGLNHQTHSEYYCLPLVMVTLMLFDSNKSGKLIFGIASAFVTWILIENSITLKIGSISTDSYFPYDLISKINFIGAFTILAFFIVIFNSASKKRLLYEVGLITKLKVDQELLAAERLKVAHSAKMASIGEMSAGLAHEINNPLATILSSISLLRKTKDNEKIFDSTADTIERASDRISQIVEGLKKFSHTSQAMPYKAESISVLIQEAKTLVEMRIRQVAVPIKLVLSSDSHLFCNENEIVQVLINLINNAIDAAKIADEKWVEVLLFDEGLDVVVQVINSGPVISKSIQDKMFNPFFTTKDIGEGTGLGLSISKGLLDLHNASIQVNANHKNTCLEIRFKKYIKLPAASSASS